MNILGLDTSTHFGWAFSRDSIYRCGVEHFPPNPEQSDAFRLSKINKWFRELVERAQPEHIFRERMFIPASQSRGGKLLIKIEGIVDLVAADCRIPIDVIAPTSLKKFFTSNGKASKETMVKYANVWWSDKVNNTKPITNNDIADAIACLSYGKEMME